MSLARHLLPLAALVAVAFAGTAVAAPAIDVSFEAGDADSQQRVHAVTDFPVSDTTVHAVFEAITDYSQLHDWIRSVKQVNTATASRQYLVEFKLPWPVGRQWSRVEVRQVGDTISWTQIEGTLKANDGQIRFSQDPSGVRIDYRAGIDIGLPEAFSRPFKAQFVRQFLTAACKKAEKIDATAGMMVARGN